MGRFGLLVNPPRSKRPRIDNEDETSTELESDNSQHSAGLENQHTPDKSGKPTSQQLEGSDIGQDDQASRPTVASSTRDRPSKSKLPKPIDYLQNDKGDTFTELDQEIKSCETANHFQ
jgi:hypothetical protein